MPANPISSVAGPGATASSANVPAQAAAAGLTGDDYLKATEQGDPNQKSINDYVRGVVAGTRDLPNVSDKNHLGFAINRRLDEAYPGVDKSLFAIRRQTLKSFAPGGKDAQKNAALSQATEHGAAYVDAMENLHNPTGNTSINTAYNWIRSGNPFTEPESEDTFKARHNNAAQKANAFQEETGRVFKQVGPVTDSERKTLENMNNLNDPAGAQRAGIKAVFELYKGRFDTQADQYNKGAHLEGTGQEKTGLDFMSPQAMSLYLKVTGMPPAPKIGTVLKGDDNTNHRYVGGDPGNPNNWKAMQ
jgi:hypothetical protein